MLIDFKKVLEHGVQPKNVIHIGAHYGEEAKAYKEAGVEHCCWIDANPNVLPILKENTDGMFEDQFHFLACLTDKDGEYVEFNISNIEGQSSSILQLAYHKEAHPEVIYVEKIGIHTQTLDALLERNSISPERYDFMNADIQGAELLMLKGAESVLPHLKAIYMEVNEKEVYAGCPLVEEIDDFLAEYGFVRVETEWAGDFGWGDALYVKEF